MIQQQQQSHLGHFYSYMMLQVSLISLQWGETKIPAKSFLLNAGTLLRCWHGNCCDDSWQG